MNEKQRPSLGHVVKSILGAALGVQSEETRKKDFGQGHPAVYIGAAIAFVVVFIVILLVVVNLVLSSAGV